MTDAAPAGSNFHIPPIFRVFEHDRLQVGHRYRGQLFTPRHFNSLIHWTQQYGERYFAIGHQSIRFRHFAGILATPELTVEILPKVDRDSDSDDGASWQGVLVDLLTACRFVRLESSGPALLNTRPGSLLHWYLQTFANELELLVQQGLQRSYHAKEDNLPVLKGRLHLAQQLRRNAVHRERFYVTYQTYTKEHPANLIIGAALQQLQLLALPRALQVRLAYLAGFFPQPAAADVLRSIDHSALQRDQQLRRYHYALSIARHILQEERPGIRAGRFRGLSLLFDMNHLFEEYLFRQLSRWKPPDVSIERQESRSFWGANRLRPDLVVSGPQGRWVLDTKWRVLHNGQPTADELRQIYVYCDYFDARKGVLIFPQTKANPGSYHRAFAATSGLPNIERECRVYFAPVLHSDGRLNRQLGKQLFTDLITH